jgi:hypothetical protein
MCLDVMRVLGKHPAALELLAAECAEVKGRIAISTVRGGSCTSCYGGLRKSRAER